MVAPIFATFMSQDVASHKFMVGWYVLSTVSMPSGDVKLAKIVISEQY